MRALLFTAAAAALLTLAACSDDSATPAADAAQDLPQDIGYVAADAPPDLTPDQRADTTPCKLVKPYSSKDAVCNACAEAKCCVEINGCLGDTKCDDDYVNCILVCSMAPEPDAA